jgi:hypothetical protein
MIRVCHLEHELRLQRVFVRLRVQPIVPTNRLWMGLTSCRLLFYRLCLHGLLLLRAA